MNIVQNLRSSGKALRETVRRKAGIILATVMVAAYQAQNSVLAAAAADTVTTERVESLKLTVEAGFALIVTIITAALGIRLYRKLGKRAIGAA